MNLYDLKFISLPFGWCFSWRIAKDGKWIMDGDLKRFCILRPGFGLFGHTFIIGPIVFGFYKRKDY